MNTADHGEHALAAGWATRAAELVDEIGEDCVERGWVAFLRMFRAIGEGDFAQAQALADEANATGRRFHDRRPDRDEHVRAGARVPSTPGASPRGWPSSTTRWCGSSPARRRPSSPATSTAPPSRAAQEISDFGRVAEWTAALERWCDAQPGLLAFTGQCAVHRGQLLRLRGAWDDALREYSRAAERYVELGTPGAIGLTAVETGDVLRLRGDLDGRRRGLPAGRRPRRRPAAGPGPAVAGRAAGARPRSRPSTGCSPSPADPCSAATCCRRPIEVLLASGLVDRARPLAVELSSLASSIGSAVLSAAAAPGDGRGRARRRRRRRRPPLPRAGRTSCGRRRPRRTTPRSPGC